MRVQCELAPMTLQDTDADETFGASSDARFPYDDASASTLIRQGSAISLNAAFNVLDELHRLKTASEGRDRARPSGISAFDPS
jgi:hypothetical protein